MKIQTLKEQLQKLHLRGMEDILDETLKKAATDNLSPADVLTILAEHEIALRKQKLIKARIAQAAFPNLKTIDAFDFNFPKNINKSKILDLFDLGFVHQKQNVILMVSPRTLN
jgi:DNA replication protein DnaC